MTPKLTKMLRTAGIGLFLTMLVLVVMASVNPLTQPMGADSGVFAYLGRQILRGHTLYLTAWDQKPPGVFLINALGLWMGAGTRWGIWGIEMVFLLLATYCLWLLVQRILGELPAVAACLAWTAGIFLLISGAGNFTEEYSLVFNLAALLLYFAGQNSGPRLRQYWFLGVLLGCAILIQPKNTGPILSLFLLEFLLVMQGRLDVPAWIRRLLAALGGLAVPAAAMVVYFVPRGAWDAFLQASFLYNFSYSAKPDVVGALTSGLVAVGPPVGMAVIGLAASTRNWRRGREQQSDSVRLLALWLILDVPLEIILSSLSGRAYHHYFIMWMPAVAVACAFAVDVLDEQLLRYMRRYLAAAITALAIGAILLNLGSLAQLVHGAYNLIVLRRDFQLEERVPAWIRSHSDPADTVFVWGHTPAINFLANRDAPSAHILYGDLVDSPYSITFSEQFLHDVQVRPPRLIVDTSYRERIPALSAEDPVGESIRRGVYPQPLVQVFFDWLHAHYTATETVDNMIMYQRQP